MVFYFFFFLLWMFCRIQLHRHERVDSREEDSDVPSHRRGFSLCLRQEEPTGGPAISQHHWCNSSSYYSPSDFYFGACPASHYSVWSGISCWLYFIVRMQNCTYIHFKFHLMFFKSVLSFYEAAISRCRVNYCVIETKQTVYQQMMRWTDLISAGK